LVSEEEDKARRLGEKKQFSVGSKRGEGKEGLSDQGKKEKRRSP